MAIFARAAGAWAAVNATTQTLTLPAHAVGDMLVVIAACKASTITSADPTITTPASGWTRFATFADGTTNSGNGTGSVRQAIFYKVAASSSETSPVVTWGGSQTAAPGLAVALGFGKAGTETWIDPVAVQAATNAATSISVTMGSNPGITADDWGVIAHTTADDSALTVPTWTATGATLAAAVVYPTTAIASGTSNDMAATAAYRSVTSGLASAAPVVTATQAAAETGVTCFIRLRVTSVTPPPAAGGTTGYSATVTGDSPVSYWRMGEASGSVLDSVGTNHGTTGGTVTRDVAGALAVGDDGAISFAAAGWVEVPDNASLDLGDVVTVEAWVKSAAGGGARAIADRNTNMFYFGLNNDNTLQLNKSNVAGIVTSTIIVPGTGWHHVVATKNGATVKLYIDGADVTGTVTNSTLANNALSLFIGSSDTVNQNMTGSIDELAIYGTALSAAQVLNHYNQGAFTRGLVITGFAPTVTTTENQLVTPTTAALTLTKFAPVLNETTTPSTASLTTAKFAPTVTASDNQLVTPTTKSVALSTFAPTISLTDNQLVTPSTASLAVTAFAPVLKETTTPTTAALSTTGFAPTVTASDHQAVIPTTKALTLATFAPTVTATTGSNITATPDSMALTLTSFAPTVSTPQTVTPTTASLITARFEPTISNPVTTTPTTRALTLTTHAPVIRQTVTPTTTSLTLSTFAPTVTTTTNTRVELQPATGLVLTGYAPTIALSAHKLVIPPTLGLVLTTYPPTAEQHSITPLPRIVSGTVVIARGPGATVTPLSRGSTTVVAIRRPSARVRR